MAETSTLSKVGKSPTYERDVAVASLLFTAVGVGYLFPFSALTQPVDYWHKIFPEFNIEFPITTMFMWVNLTALFLLVFLGGEPSYTWRVVGGFTGQLLVLIMVPSLYFLHMEESMHFIMIMVATGIVAIATAFVDSVAISFASQYPQDVQVALQFGIGFSTLIGSIYRIVTKLVFPIDQVVESSLLYFYSGAATILLCIYAYFVILGLPLTKQCVKFGVEIEENPESGDSKALLSDPEEGSFELTQKSSIAANLVDSASYGAFDATTPGPNRSLTSAATGADVVVTAGGEIDKWTLLRKVAFSELMLFTVFFSTLLLWPPLITEIKSFNFPYLQETQWWPLILLTIFSSADCIGRVSLPFRMGLNSSNIWVAVLLRLILFPLLICSAKGIYFTHDAFSVFFVFCLGFTNGYLGSLTIILINEQVEEKDKGVVGMFSGFFLNMGCVLGASGACFVEKWVLSG
mmetsp:Transcript_67147/g.132220  ORF Transcript_67147/g.132220 Transcript_67147/m.132220 type:complete len:462 (+) Transcript_67147:25-1410(+)